MSGTGWPWLAAYDHGLAPTIEIPETTLADRFARIEAGFADRPAVHFSSLTLCYRQLFAAADRFAAALRSYGYGRGDTVCICLPNVPQYLIALIGTIRAGATVSGLSALLTPPEMAHQLNDCRARAVVALDVIVAQKIGRIVDRLPGLETIVSTNAADLLPWHIRLPARLLRKVPSARVGEIPGRRVVRFAELLARFPADTPKPAAGPDDLAFIQYTGGTTGLPKGTMLTHRNLVANLSQIASWTGMEPGTEVALSAFPLFHQAGLCLGLSVIDAAGSQVLVPDPRNTARIAADYARHRPTSMANVPSLMMMLMARPEFVRADHGRLRYCICAAAPFPVDSIRALERIIGRGKVIELYGMTEASPVIAVNPLHGVKKPGTVGLPIQNTLIRLADLGDGEGEAPPGTEGEICVCGPQVMKGYLNRPDETARALREHDGRTWLHTGDIGRMDADGYLTLVDRSKDMLIVSGYKVFSREVEELLYTHPAVRFCAVVGVPDERRPGSQLVKLVVQLQPERQGTDEQPIRDELTSLARENVAPYKVPKIVVFTDAMPLTAVGKVDKKALRGS